MTDSENTDPTGRVMRFIHEGESELPVRDVKANNKPKPALEPCIEYGWERDLNTNIIIGAENYYSCCYQGAVRNVVESDDDYLFLASYPQHPGNNASENLIVGYIRHDDHEWRAGDRVAIIGEMKLYPFEHGVPLSELGYQATKWSLGGTGRNLNEAQTREVLAHFNQISDVTQECLDRTLDLEEGGQSGTNGGC